MIFVLTGILVSYSALVLILIAGWHRAIQARPIIQQSAIIQWITIIIPFRNEAQHIHLLLQDLIVQAHPPDEIILVDDHSTDQSVEVITGFLESLGKPAISIRVHKNSGEGKKQALTTGIRMASGSIIVTVDADCRVGPDWLKSIQNHFGEEKIKLLFGPVAIEQRSSFFSIVQSMEFSSLIGSGAATAALGFPTMCNGSNLAFRKVVFEAVGGYTGNLHIASGDDEFLMRKIEQDFPGSVHFNADPASIVVTRPAEKFSSFFQQRLRWASKWKHNSSATASLLAAWIFLVQASIIVSFFLFKIPLVLMLILRAMVEYIFLRKVQSFLSQAWSWRAFIFLQLFYPVYVITIGFASQFFSFLWKDRRG
ncbi:MAG: glycosyltransferase [Cyclobacteriaceae bacterium]|nr:glycosyltransferase [Cyclobacteriaceae bacterium]